MEAWPARLRLPETPQAPGRGRARYFREDPAMQKPTEDQIRQRAQEIWERNHRPDGRDEEFWHQAERELEHDSSQHDPSHGDVPGAPEAPRVMPG
jgi:hypothetical protein